MDNQHTIEKNDLNTNNTYKHSLSECSVKLNGIKYLLEQISQITADNNTKHMVDSASAMCDELLRELEQ